MTYIVFRGWPHDLDTWLNDNAKLGFIFKSMVDYGSQGTICAVMER